MALSAVLHAGEFCTDNIAITRATGSGYLLLVDQYNGDSCAEADDIGGPAGVAYGRNGNIFVWIQNSGPLLEFTPSGNFVRTVVELGTAGSIQGRGIAQTLDGNWLIAGGSSNRVVMFDETTGAYLSDFVQSGDGGLDTCFGLTFGPDGMLYVASFGSSEIKRYDGTTGTFIDTFVSANAGGLTTPYDLRFGLDRHLYVSDRDTGLVFRFDGETGAFIDIFSNFAIAPARGLAFGPRGNLLVCSWQGPSGGGIYEFDRWNGSFIGQLAPAPAAIFVATPERIFLPGDLNKDALVNAVDLFMLLSAWGDCPVLPECPPGCAADLNSDCVINVSDLFILLANWG